jgi:hypothetical protein
METIIRAAFESRSFSESGSTHLRVLWRQSRIHADLIQLGTGPLARIGPNDLITSSPELLWRINGVRSTYTKGGWYNGSRIQPGRDNVFSGIDEDHHTKRRAQLAPAVSLYIPARHID